MAAPIWSKRPRKKMRALTQRPSSGKKQDLLKPIVARDNDCGSYLFVRYSTSSKRAEYGEIKGQVIEITPPRAGETVRGFKEGDWLGFTKMPLDKDLWNRLMTGINTVDVDKTTIRKIAISSKADLYRIEASRYVSLDPTDWRKSSHYQAPADERVYSDYIVAFLTEFTRVIRHIPTHRLAELYPHAWLFPTATSVYVARDGIAIVFDYPSRPEIARITVNIDGILDKLLLPHPPGKAYTSNGPTRLTQSICGDQNFVFIRGNGNYIHASALGNPVFAILEKRYHGFWEECGIFRGYGDGTSTKEYFKFVELFGDISESNFTEEKAKARAGLYAGLWAARTISGGRVDNLEDLRTVIRDLINMMARADVDEPEVERFLDRFPWILERGLGYKRYHSQVAIDKSHLSLGERGICPDKFLERNDGYCDILDLKRPDARVMVGSVNRRRASADLSEAEAQVDKYVSLAMEPRVRDELLRRGIRVWSPRGLVLIGRRPGADLDDWEDVKRRSKVRVYTYDDVVEEMEAIISWIEGIVRKREWRS